MRNWQVIFKYQLRLSYQVPFYRGSGNGFVGESQSDKGVGYSE